MKKLFPILLAMALFASACQAGGAQAEPTALSLPTAFPTNTPSVNAPVEASGKPERRPQTINQLQLYHFTGNGNHECIDWFVCDEH